MKTSLFDFDLSGSLIATQPAIPRDSARMLVVAGALQDKVVHDLPSFLKPGDVMVFNDTKVLPARLTGKRGAAKIEVLLHKQAKPSFPPQMGEAYWLCFAKPAKRLKPGDRIVFADDFFAEVVEKCPDGQVALRFNYTDIEFHDRLANYGHMPLPPYIARPDVAADKENYQTVYARHAGSVAAPTAGLHFTESLLSSIDAMGVQRVYVTLHVGGGTFLPVKAEDTKNHKMHSEYAVITQQTADTVNAAKKNGGRVIAVGTTSLRALESAVDEQGMVRPIVRETDIFITPGYRFQCVDNLLTNFHLPKSTLFMLVCAFAGMGRMKNAYNHAISRKYRFYSYGDACLLYKDSEFKIRD